MALRAVNDSPVAAVISWVGSILYFVAAQVVAVVSTVEIGPNLLSAITAIIGAVVLLGQAYLASRVKRVAEHAAANTHKAEVAKERADDAADRVETLEQKVNGG